MSEADSTTGELSGTALSQPPGVSDLLKLELPDEDKFSIQEFIEKSVAQSLGADSVSLDPSDSLNLEYNSVRDRYVPQPLEIRLQSAQLRACN
jgi:hypothetical protein